MTFEKWKAECAEHAKNLVHIYDLLSEDDPYDLFHIMDDAYPDQSPLAFVEEMFEDQLARQASDGDQLEESLEHEEE